MSDCPVCGPHFVGRCPHVPWTVPDADEPSLVARLETLTRERDAALAEVARLRAELDLVRAVGGVSVARLVDAEAEVADLRKRAGGSDV